MKDDAFSIFDIHQNQTDIASKIVVALERVSEVFRVLLWEKAKQYQLSPLQIQLLIFIKFHDIQFSKVTYLAQEFNMTKATISDAIRILIEKSLLRKERVENDRRSFCYHLTPAGEQLTKDLATFAQPLRKMLMGWTKEQQVALYDPLFRLIGQAQKSGLIHLQRMCFHCKHYQNQDQKHFCRFLQIELSTADLRIDCEDFQAPSSTL